MRNLMGGRCPRKLAASVRLVWLCVLALHVALALLALRCLPHGFPLLHARTVLGTFAPVGIGAGSVALGAALVLAPQAAVRCLPVIPAFWGSAALALLVLFPVSGATAARCCGSLALGLAVLAAVSARGHAWLELLPAGLFGALTGPLVAACERPAPANTAPWPSGVTPKPVAGEASSGSLELGSELSVESSTLSVSFRGQKTTITIAPVLEFSRISPDGFWSIFALNAAGPPQATTVRWTPEELSLATSDGTARLDVRRGLDHVSLDAWTLLERPVYSHLNSFTSVTVSGHERLGLRFSPCPAGVIAVTHADYPAGAPARFAYVDASRHFHVVQATDAEKGPFIPLAEGILRADATLGIELVELGDGSRTFARLEFTDFAGELSTALSPTAGYGVTENAVEFGVADAAPSSPAHLVLALAASGVGRGWDTVGHRAGAYRNRVTLRAAELAPPPEPGTQLAATALAACADMARDIAALKPRFRQLAAFEPTAVSVRAGECSLGHAYHTHRSTRRGGWMAQVPEPEPDGIWFHIGVWDPQGPARLDQLNTQPGFSVHALGDDNVTVLILDGEKSGALTRALWSLLRRHGVAELRR
jgi:hypothetical protein